MSKSNRKSHAPKHVALQNRTTDDSSATLSIVDEAAQRNAAAAAAAITQAIAPPVSPPLPTITTTQGDTRIVSIAPSAREAARIEEANKAHRLYKDQATFKTLPLSDQKRVRSIMRAGGIRVSEIEGSRARVRSLDSIMQRAYSAQEAVTALHDKQREEAAVLNAR